MPVILRLERFLIVFTVNQY